MSASHTEFVVIDGAYGEGGGQVLRSAVALAALLGRAVRIENIRAKRRNPGLQAQHLTGVQAAARICAARLEGAHLGSTTLEFVPQRPPQAGTYEYDVAEARRGGSAGSTSLVLQTVLPPLLFADGISQVTVHGGTHVAWSPPYHYLAEVFLPVAERMGIACTLTLERWGWYPHGGGTVHAEIHGLGPHTRLRAITLLERGALVRLTGFSAVSNLPRHILERQAKAAEALLRRAGYAPRLARLTPQASGPGTAVYLQAEYAHVRAGFIAYGRRGKPAEAVAQEAVDAFLAYDRTGAALDPHLADQLILPMALADGPSAFTTSEITAHLLTNVWVVQHFIDVHVEIEGEQGTPGKVTLHV